MNHKMNKSLDMLDIVAHYITPAIKYLNIVIPAKAGIQEGTGCRIKSGMTELDYLVARLISSGFTITRVSFASGA